MLRRSFLVGLALGLIAGVLALETGVLIVLLVVPAFIWGSRERGSPVGCGGLLVGTGAAMAAILALGEWRCSTDPSCHMSTPLGGFYLLGGALVLAGLVAVGSALTRRRGHDDRGDER